MSTIQDPNRALLIIGAGPAGLSAALAAANAGWQITVVDDNPVPGGQIWRSGPGAAPSAPAQRLRAALAACPDVRLVCGTRVVAAQGANALLNQSIQGGRTADQNQMGMNDQTRLAYLSQLTGMDQNQLAAQIAAMQAAMAAMERLC